MFRVIVDTSYEAEVNLHLDNGKVVTFEEVGSGLYLFNDKVIIHNSKHINLSLFPYISSRK